MKMGAYGFVIMCLKIFFLLFHYSCDRNCGM